VTEDLSLALPVSTASATSAAPPEARPDLRETLADLPALVDTYSALLFRVAHSILRNRSEAEDVVQDTFVRLLEHRRTLPFIRDLRVWLVRITWNLALDRRRRIRPDQMDSLFAATLVSAHTPADQILAETQQKTALLREIDNLPKPERQALLLSTVEELNALEIARIMAKSESSVRSLLFRARERLRSRLQQTKTTTSKGATA
jgi:RNA polymerase sigma-70 factor, ECF subfamily